MLRETCSFDPPQGQTGSGRLILYSLALSLTLHVPLSGQTAHSRIRGTIDATALVESGGNLSPRAQAKFERGPANPSLKLPDLVLLLKPSPQQQSDLDQFVIDQQDPSSPHYHQWLSPEEFADRFAASPSDMQKIEGWLAGQGFQVSSRAQARNWIAFSGTVEQVERTFRTSIRRYAIDGEDHYANSTEPLIPAALSGIVGNIRGLDDFRLKPLLRRPSRQTGPRPAYTDSFGEHNLGPADLANIYDLNPLYNAGFDGTGQKIAVIGQTDIVLSDIAAFRSIFNLPPNVPQLVLFGRDPGTNVDDRQEAALDLEWSGAVARNATLLYVYSTDVFNSVMYAVDQNLAPVISMSYGFCEADGAGILDTYRTMAQQAASQGISWVAATGDTGAADCDSGSSAKRGKAVMAPASIPEVTAAGGTEFNEGTGVYWNSGNTTNQASVLGYIPEVAWNDTAANGSLTSTGGGVSIHYPTPAWQTGAGFPNDGHRDLPDIAMNASANHDGYIVCVDTTNCPSNWKTLGGGRGYSIVGGTSASAPVFAGILTILNHYLVARGFQSKAGLGSANKALYSLARTSPSAFHDVTSGNNIVPCRTGTADCSTGSFGYAAAIGYDQATGLGSVDAYNLVTAWPGGNPQIVSISPSAPSVSATAQTIGVSGSGFQSGLTVSVVSPNNVTSAATAFAITTSSFSTTLTLNAAGTWKLQVTSPGGQSSNVFSFTVTQPVINLTVWRPANGAWYVHPPSGTIPSVAWGQVGDIPVFGDVAGTGALDYIVWRPAIGTWYVNPTGGTITSTQWGTPGDVPVAGDFDGDGKTDLAVWRPVNGSWYIIPSSNPGSPIAKAWGQPGDVPIVADFDGDGKVDYAVWRPANGTWYVILSTTGQIATTQWGQAGDIPVPADFDGDGKADMAVWRPANGTWYIIPSTTRIAYSVQWGTSGDVPVPRDYDSDRKADPAVWRPVNGTWYIIPSTTPAATLAVQWGQLNDVPIYKTPGS